MSLFSTWKTWLGRRPAKYIRRQPGVGWCGPACLSSCFATMGIDMTSQEIHRVSGRRLKDLEWDGMSVTHMRRVCQHYGVRLEEVSYRTQALGTLFLERLEQHLSVGPAVVLVYDYFHWMAVLGRTRRGFLLMDPDIGAVSTVSFVDMLELCWNDDGKTREYCGLLLTGPAWGKVVLPSREMFLRNRSRAY